MSCIWLRSSVVMANSIIKWQKSIQSLKGNISPITNKEEKVYEHVLRVFKQNQSVEPKHILRPYHFLERRCDHSDLFGAIIGGSIKTENVEAMNKMIKIEDSVTRCLKCSEIMGCKHVGIIFYLYTDQVNLIEEYEGNILTLNNSQQMVCNICNNIIILHVGENNSPTAIVNTCFNYVMMYNYNVNKTRIWHLGTHFLNLINPEICDNMIDRVNGPNNIIGSIWKMWPPKIRKDSRTEDVLEDLVINATALFAWYHPNLFIQGKLLLKNISDNMTMEEIISELINGCSGYTISDSESLIQKVNAVIEQQIMKDEIIFRDLVDNLAKLLVTAYFNEVVSAPRTSEVKSEAHICYPPSRIWSFNFPPPGKSYHVKDANPIFSATQQEHQHIVVDGKCASCSEDINDGLNLEQYKLLTQSMLTLKTICEAGVAHAYGVDGKCHYCGIVVPEYKELARMIKAGRVKFGFKNTYMCDPLKPIEPARLGPPNFTLTQHGESVFLSNFIEEHKEKKFFNFKNPKPYETINVVKKFLWWFLVNLTEEMKEADLYYETLGAWNYMCEVLMSGRDEARQYYKNCVNILISVCYSINGINICANKKLNTKKLLTSQAEYLHLSGDNRMHGVSPLNLRNFGIDMSNESDIISDLESFRGTSDEGNNFDPERFIDEVFDGQIPTNEEDEPVEENSDFEDLEDPDDDK